MYYRARYYDLTLGRFVSADAIVPEAGNPQSLNRYAYVKNNPLRYVDPSGNLTEEQINRWVDVNIDELDQQTLDLLLALHFGDELHLLLDGETSTWGYAGLSDKGLQFSNGSKTFTANSIVDMREKGGDFWLTRSTGGGELRYAYLPWDDISDWPGTLYGPDRAFESVTGDFEAFWCSRLTQKLKKKSISGAIGAGLGSLTGQPMGTVGGFLLGVMVSEAFRKAFPEGPLPGNKAGDEILEYWYDDGLYEVTFIRDNRVLETRWNTWWEITP